MFDIGAPEILVLIIAAVFLFGPEKLPDFARQAGRMLRTVRQLAASARSDLDRELGPGFASLKSEDLDPRRLVQRHIFDVLDEDDKVLVLPGQTPLTAGEQPPYDTDAT